CKGSTRPGLLSAPELSSCFPACKKQSGLGCASSISCVERNRTSSTGAPASRLLIASRPPHRRCRPESRAPPAHRRFSSRKPCTASFVGGLQDATACDNRWMGFLVEEQAFTVREGQRVEHHDGQKILPARVIL